MSEGRFNLSALAVRERSITLFLIVLISLAGLVAFLKLGRAEDPAFTVAWWRGQSRTVSTPRRNRMAWPPPWWRRPWAGGACAAHPPGRHRC